MSKHTPEPWFYHRQGFSTVYIEARIGGGMLQEIAACGPCQDGAEQQDENARRIVACVNACRGLPTDELERKGLVAAVGNQLLELEHKRDELMARISEIDGCFEAALIEGWLDAVADEDISRIKDIYCRRIGYAREIAAAALAGGVA